MNSTEKKEFKKDVLYDNFIPVKIKFNLNTPKIGLICDESWLKHCSLNEHTTFGNTEEWKNYLEGKLYLLRKDYFGFLFSVPHVTDKKKDSTRERCDGNPDQAKGSFYEDAINRSMLGNGK